MLDDVFCTRFCKASFACIAKWVAESGMQDEGILRLMRKTSSEEDDALRRRHIQLGEDQVMREIIEADESMNVEGSGVGPLLTSSEDEVGETSDSFQRLHKYLEPEGKQVLETKGKERNRVFEGNSGRPKGTEEKVGNVPVEASLDLW